MKADAKYTGETIIAENMMPDEEVMKTLYRCSFFRVRGLLLGRHLRL